MEELSLSIYEQIELFTVEMSKFQDGNKAAGARARKHSLALEKLLKQFRKDSVAANK